MSRARVLAMLAGISLWGSVGVAQSTAYVGGLQYGVGDFTFSRRTWSVYFTNGIVWTRGRLRAAATVPLIWQPGGWLQYNGSGMMSPTGPGDTSTTMIRNGMMGSGDMGFRNVRLGDPVGRVDAGLIETEGRAFRLGVSGAIKAPLLGMSHGFGTGVWDAGAGLTASQRVAGGALSADAVYWRLGNPPGGLFRNALVYSVVFGRPMATTRWSVLAAVNGATSLWTGLAAPVQAGGGFGYTTTSGSSVFATISAGLSSTAPTLSTALGWRVPLHQSP